MWATQWNFHNLMFLFVIAKHSVKHFVQKPSGFLVLNNRLWGALRWLLKRRKDVTFFCGNKLKSAFSSRKYRLVLADIKTYLNLILLTSGIQFCSCVNVQELPVWLCLFGEYYVGKVKGLIQSILTSDTLIARNAMSKVLLMINITISSL